MNTFKYFKWNGTSPFELSQEKLQDEFIQRMLANSDVSEVVWEMQRNTFRDSKSHHPPSLDDLLDKIQHQKQIQLSRYDLNSILNEIRQGIDEIIKTEKSSIEKKLEEIRGKYIADSKELDIDLQKKLLKSLEDKAWRNRQKLDNLPLNIGGKIRELNNYDFINPDAKKRFDEIMELIKKHTLNTYVRELIRDIRKLDPSILTQIRQMAKDLNRMLEQRMLNQRIDYDTFKQQYSKFWGPKPPENLDELINRLQDQISQAQSLLNSLSREQQEVLESIFNSALDRETQFELAKLGANLEYLNQNSQIQGPYSFFGDESISYDEALKLMETLQKMDKLENQIKNSRFKHSLEDIDSHLIREILGDDSADKLEAMRNIVHQLEESGYVRREGNSYELTPQGIRKIGERALSTVFAKLKKDRRGNHQTIQRGTGGERTYETKQFEFGDYFDVHIEKTIMNAIIRDPQRPVKLDINDFEIFKEEQLTRSATVLLLDLSLSMHMHGNFQAAKIVAIALDTLIRSQYPRDSLYVVGFSSYARRMTREDLNQVNWDNLDPYTNMQHGFSLSRRLLSKDSNTNKQVLLITDGEPTAHFENARIYFQYPPSLRTIKTTLKEVNLCTRCGIVINTFMLKSGSIPESFVNQIAKINRGRVFCTTADNLGEYLIIDYLSSKKKLRIG